MPRTLLSSMRVQISSAWQGSSNTKTKVGTKLDKNKLGETVAGGGQEEVGQWLQFSLRGFGKSKAARWWFSEVGQLGKSFAGDSSSNSQLPKLSVCADAQKVLHRIAISRIPHYCQSIRRIHHCMICSNGSCSAYPEKTQSTVTSLSTLQVDRNKLLQTEFPIIEFDPKTFQVWSIVWTPYTMRLKFPV